MTIFIPKVKNMRIYFIAHTQFLIYNFIDKINLLNNINKGIKTMNGYGEFIKRHRIASGFKSLRKLADKSGISSATISRIENEIQVPEVRTLKALSEYLETTSYVELMVKCGYWDQDELLDELNEDPKENVNEKEFIKEINLTDEELLKQFDLQLDGKSLTEKEAQGIIAYVRSLRQIGDK